MHQFMGRHTGRLDAKGRISIPAPYRAILRGGTDDPVSIVLRNSHKFPCIEAWPIPVFAELAASLRQTDVFSDDQDDMSTSIYAGSDQLDVDKEGRVQVPADCREHAALTDSVMFLGKGRIFEIWEPAAGTRRLAEAQQSHKARAITLKAGTA